MYSKMPTKRKISIFFGFGWPSTVNVSKYQHHVCFNDEPKPCLPVSIDDRQSIKRHHPKYNSHTDLLSVQLLFLRVVNCCPVHHLSHFLLLLALSDQQKCFKKSVMQRIDLWSLNIVIYITLLKIVKLGADKVHSAYVYNVVYFLSI